MRCVVKNCKNRSRDKSLNKSFFIFPREKSQLKKWIQFCRQSKPFNPKTWRMCMDHFNEDDICGDLKYQMGFAVQRRLKPGAFPCRYGPIAVRTERDIRMKTKERKEIVSALLAEDSNVECSVSVCSDQSKNTDSLVVDVSDKAQTPNISSVLELCYEEDENINDIKNEDVSNEEYENINDIENEYVSNDSTSNELDHTNYQVKTLTDEIKALKRENEALKAKMSYQAGKYEHYIDELKKQLAYAHLEFKNINEELKGIFTDQQMKK